jgi:hypothetical protein
MDDRPVLASALVFYTWFQDSGVATGCLNVSELRRRVLQCRSGGS